MKSDQWEGHINNSLPLVGADDYIPLVGISLTLVGAPLTLHVVSKSMATINIVPSALIWKVISTTLSPL